MRHLLALFCSLFIVFLPATAAAQDARPSVSGVVLDETGAPLPGVTIQAEGTTLMAVTGSDGTFTLGPLEPGRITLRALLSGFKPAVLAVDAGDAGPVRFLLEPGGHVFEQVVVREEGYAARSVTSTRTTTPLRDLPQSIQVVTRDLAADQGATYLNDTLKNVSGVNPFSDYLDFNMRGFRTSSDGAVKRDGLDQVHDFFFRPRLMNVERVEVVKGPAGALYGKSRPGGFINIVSRTPSAVRETEAALRLGSWDKSEAHLTSTGPVPGTGGLFYLGSVSRVDNESFRLHDQVEYTGVAGTLTWAPSADTAVTAGADWFDDLARGHRNRGVPFFKGRLVDVPLAYTVNEPDDAIQIRGQTFRARLDHRAGDRLRFDAGATRLTNDNTQQYHEPRGLAADGRTMRREFRDQYRERTQTAVNANAEATLAFGGIQHRVLAGAEYSRLDGLLRSGTARDSSRGGPVPDLDIYAPVYGSPLHPLRFNYYGPDVRGGIQSLRTSIANRVETRGVYVQNQMTLGSRVSALAGARYDAFSSRTLTGDERTASGSAVSLRGGVVAHLTPSWSTYGSYAQGFEPPSASLNLDPARYGGPFDPERSWSVEGGVRGAIGRRASVTASVFHITKRDVVLYSPTEDLPDRYVQIGAFESRGFEVDLAGRLTTALSVHANYAHSFLAEITEDVNPANIGKAAENNPKDAAGLWLRYNTALPWRTASAGAAAGVTYVGDRLTFTAGDILPSYTVVDAALFLSVGRVRTALNVFNLTDREHFTGGYGGRIGGFRGVPRSVELRATVRF